MTLVSLEILMYITPMPHALRSAENAHVFKPLEPRPYVVLGRFLCLVCKGVKCKADCMPRYIRTYLYIPSVLLL